MIAFSADSQSCCAPGGAARTSAEGWAVRLGALILAAVATAASAQPADAQFGPPRDVTRPAITSNSVMPVGGENPADLLDQPLAEIRITGNKTIPETAILHFVESQLGRPVSNRQIDQDTTTLLQQNWFLSVRPRLRSTDDGLVLIFEVVEKPILRSVRFVGNDKIKTKHLEALTGLVPGHGFDVAANQEAALRIKQHYQEKGFYFADVTLSEGDDPDDRSVVFEIDEGKKVRVTRIKFDGNDEIGSAILKTKLATKSAILWWIGGNYDPETIRNDAHALTRYYHALGYFDAEVEPLQEFSKEKSRVTVTFRVSEGPRFRVRSIETIGNEVIPTSSLMSKPELEEGAYYNERLLREDVNAMKDLYDDRGRLFASVEPVPRFLEESGWVDLVYHINEDRPYRIGAINVNISGDHPHSKELLVLNQVNRWLKPGDLARMRDIRGAQTILRGSSYWDRAVPAIVNVRPVEGHEYLPPTLVARGQNRVAVDSAVEESLPPRAVRFGHSVLTTPAPVDREGHHSVDPPGRARLDRDGFTSRLPVRPKLAPVVATTTTYNVDPEAIFNGQQKSEFIYRGQSIDRYGNPWPLDPLQSNSPQGDPFGDAIRNPATPGFVDVDIDVTEARTGRLMFGVGVNSDAGLVGSVVLQEDNFNILRPPTSWADIVNGHAFRGAGQSFRLELVPGTDVSRYLVSWQNPYFMNTDYSLGLSGFYYNRFYDEWTEDRLGGRISIGRLLSRYWSAGLAVRLENVDLRDIRGGAPPIATSAAGDNFLSTVQGTLTHDTRDSAFLPTEGHLLELAYEQAFGEFDYPRVEVTGAQYFTVWQRPDGYGKHILQFRGQGIWTGNDTPIFERLYGGGYSSFRGFAFRGVSPQIAGFATGGQFLALGSAEYMLPLTADDNIRAVAFTDFGTIENDVGFDQFRVSAGFGFRLAIPAMGPAPIALDFAWPIVKEPFDDERIFSFYVGFTR